AVLPAAVLTEALLIAALLVTAVGGGSSLVVPPVAGPAAAAALPVPPGRAFAVPAPAGLSVAVLPRLRATTRLRWLTLASFCRPAGSCLGDLAGSAGARAVCGIALSSALVLSVADHRAARGPLGSERSQATARVVRLSLRRPRGLGVASRLCCCRG